MTPRKKITVTRRLQGILRSQGRALKVECVREDDEGCCEFLAWISSKERGAVDRVSGRALDNSSIRNVKPEVSALIRRLERRLSVVRSDPNDVQMFPRVFAGAELSIEGKIYSHVKGSGKAGTTPKEVAYRFLEIGLARGDRVSVTNRLKEILGHLTMRHAHLRLLKGRDGRYRFGQV